MELESRVVVRVSQKEKDRLVQEAKDARMGLSAYLRKVLGCR